MNKYHNKKTAIGGQVFDSRKEAKRWADLLLLEKAGEIRNLRRQVKYELIPKQDGERAAHYVADFVFDTKLGERVEDVKGMRTPLFNLKRKLMLHVHGIRVQEV